MIRDIAARNASLDNDYGPNRGPNAADSHQLALFDADGVELDSTSAPGYARVTVAPSAWPAAVDGTKSTTVTFPAPTGEWEPAVSWQLVGDDGHVWDTADLADPLLVTAASPVGPVVAVTVFYEA